MSKVTNNTFLELTSVETLNGDAQYNYSNETGNLPAIAETVEISGFETAGNNLSGEITAVEATPPRSITLAKTTQADETHAAAGRIVHDPDFVNTWEIDSPLTNIHVSIGKWGKILQEKRPPFPKGHTMKPFSGFWPNYLLLRHAQTHQKYLSLYFRNILTPAQRKAWRDAAIGLNIRSNTNPTKQLNGAQFFTKVNRAWSITDYNKYQIAPPWPNPHYINPPGAWNPLVITDFDATPHYPFSYWPLTSVTPAVPIGDWCIMGINCPRHGRNATLHTKSYVTNPNQVDIYGYGYFFMTFNPPVPGSWVGTKAHMTLYVLNSVDGSISNIKHKLVTWT